MNSYSFVSKNGYTVEFSVTGEYDGMCKDLWVVYSKEGPDGREGNDRTFDEIDAGSVDDVLEWLDDEGVEFESGRTRRFNKAVVASCMLVDDATLDELLDEFAAEEDRR